MKWRVVEGRRVRRGRLRRGGSGLNAVASRGVLIGAIWRSWHPHRMTTLFYGGRTATFTGGLYWVSPFLLDLDGLWKSYRVFTGLVQCMDFFLISLYLIRFFTKFHPVFPRHFTSYCWVLRTVSVECNWFSLLRSSNWIFMEFTEFFSNFSVQF